MAGAYRHEPLVPATLNSAATNLAILRTQQSAKKGRQLTYDQSTAAIQIAIQFERIAYRHALRRNTP
jgi:hypothetical protein